MDINVAHRKSKFQLPQWCIIAGYEISLGHIAENEVPLAATVHDYLASSAD